MQIVKFRIWNYKSIVDTGDCYPSKGVTIFAGKNESGKTSILEALEDFNIGATIREKAIPIGKNDAKPTISITYRAAVKGIKEIFNQIGFSGRDHSEESLEVTVIKEYPGEYKISKESASKLGLATASKLGLTNVVSNDVIADIETTLEILKTLNDSYSPGLGAAPLPEMPVTPDVSVTEFNTFKEMIEKYKSEVASNLENLPEGEQKVLSESLDTILELCKTATAEENPVTSFIDEFVNNIPQFILFSSFNDVFPNVIPLNELDNNEWIRDLGEISNIDIATIQSNVERTKIKHKTELNIKMNDDYSKFWQQDLSKIVIDWDNQNVYFWIEENGEYYEPEIRSQGKRWHLAFYVKVTARAREDVENIILIDEPGLYLHAKAQQDVLKNLESAASEGAQVFFSTHSPYLLEANKLARIRLVLKTDKLATVIENKIHKVADKETLTPILTAIGLELSSGIAQLDRINNVVVEGPSDYYYLNALRKLVGGKEMNFVYGGGAGNMPMVGTILQGWGCNVIYLYDNDKGFKQATRNIKKHWLTTAEKVIAKIPVEGGAIEDIFSKADFIGHILGEDDIEVEGSNSDYLKEKGDKVLLAKQFFENAEAGELALDAETIRNAGKLFEILEELLGKST